MRYRTGDSCCLTIRSVKIYGLYANDQLFYVGYTTTSLETRLYTHLCSARSGVKKMPVYDVINANKGKVSIREIHSFPVACRYNDLFRIIYRVENWWINHFRDLGFPLVNIFPIPNSKLFLVK